MSDQRLGANDTNNDVQRPSGTDSVQQGHKNVTILKPETQDFKIKWLTTHEAQALYMKNGVPRHKQFFSRYCKGWEEGRSRFACRLEEETKTLYISEQSLLAALPRFQDIEQAKIGRRLNGSNPVDPPEALVEELRKRSDEENIVDVVDELKHELNESKSYIGKLENEKKVLDAEKKALENRTVHLTTKVKAKEELIDNFERQEEKLLKIIQNNARLVGILEEKLRQIEGSVTPQKENKNNTVEYVVNDNTTTQDINNSQNENEQG